jgi:hypothetical protein
MLGSAWAHQQIATLAFMADELLFTVVGPHAAPAEPIGLAEAGLKERSDLQEWVLAHPEILGSGVKVVTFEFDRWATSSGPTPQDRLDVLGLGTDGRLVVAELKRDKAPDTTEMQAIKYAAMVSRFTTESLAEQYARFRKAHGESMTSDEALGELQAHAPEISIKTLRQPRIVLLARDYPMVVTASVVWLCERGLDISLMQFQAYRATAPDEHGVSHSQVLVSVSQLYPVRDVEDFMVSPERHQALESAGRLWDEETYLLAAEERLPEAEATFVQQLLDDVAARGTGLGWGSRVSPNVSGHYLVGGRDTTVWVMNISKASLELRLLYLAKSLEVSGQDFSRLEQAAQILSGVAAAKFDTASAKEWNSSIFLPLSEIVPTYTQEVIGAIGAIIDPQV